MNERKFQQLLRHMGEELYRDMPWRADTRPYYVLVSELMLQQTQVSRVVPKFALFVERFPDEPALARAHLADVLTLWQGLGYNRRAKYLHQAAQMIVSHYGGVFPEDPADILKLPGVGKNTAGAILAYAFNQPAIFIETNIRTVYIHHFFADNFAVDDAEIIARVEATIDRRQPRRFYQNLMDYGTWLKRQGVRNTSQSRHYRTQSPLKGSMREVRGQIIRELAGSDLDIDELRRAVGADERFPRALDALQREGMATEHNGRWTLRAHKG